MSSRVPVYAEDVFRLTMSRHSPPLTFRQLTLPRHLSPESCLSFPVRHDIFRHRPYTGKHRLALTWFRQPDAVVPFQNKYQFKGIDGIKSEPFRPEKRLVRVDVFRNKVFKVQRLDYLTFEFSMVMQNREYLFEGGDGDAES